MMPGMETSPPASTAVRRSPGTIASALGEEEDLGRAAAVFRVSGVSRAIEQAGPCTVLAPTDEAFEKLSRPQTYVGLLQPQHLRQLLSILRYHVVLASYSPAQLQTTKQLPTMEGPTISVATSGTEILLDGKAVVTERTRATNGWLYRVDTVLVPDR